MRRHNLSHNGQQVEALVWHCETFMERTLGWIGQSPIPDHEVLRIPGCRAIHTFGVRHAMDVVFTDPSGRVLRCVRALPPRRVAVHRAASAAWEMRAGLAAQLGVESGSELRVAAELS